jgi:uncharacterized protein YutE (UPF0331/DUF86 family)
LSVVTGKVDIVRRMLAGIATLPLASKAEFLADPRMVAAGESFLRRALEAIFDLGRHILAKGFAVAASEYKAIATALLEHGVVDVELAQRMTEMAGYRNRLVHFYGEVTPGELYEILQHHLGDLDACLAAIQVWIAKRPELFDRSL